MKISLAASSHSTATRLATRKTRFCSSLGPVFTAAVVLAAALNTACVSSSSSPAATPDAEEEESSANNSPSGRGARPIAPAQEKAPEPTPDQTSPAAGKASPAIVAAVEASDRSEEDRALDAQRHPAETLSFFKIKPGMIVADLAAGGGYTSELIARVVGPEGKVYAQNNKFILERFAEAPLSARMQTPAMSNVERLDSEFEAPFPETVKSLDAVTMVLFYHDTVWFETDRAKMNAAIFAALKPGGFFGVIDHSARAGDGVSQAQTLHRIEESVVIEELKAAGFELVASEAFLRNPEDPRDWNASPSQAGERRGQSDRFALLFRKPSADTQTDVTEGPVADPNAPLTTCSEPRKEMCTRDYRPVCAELLTNVQCVKAPCPESKTQKTYGNACSACADPKVSAYRPGACSAE